MSTEPHVVPRAEHVVSRKNIDPSALKVLYRLHRAGYRGYLVGGGVRDILIGRRPKDFDVATDARPGEVKLLFRNSRIIGRRFKIVQVFFRDGTTVEVSTFRGLTEANGGAAPDEGDAEESLLVRRDNTYGGAEEDAKRRDLTINGLFYDIGTFSIIDYVGGLDDLKAGLIRAIGDPDIRFQEDPVRMIRAIRHSARTGFEIEPRTREMIERHAARINDCPTARVLDELYRDLRGGAAEPAVRTLHDTGILAAILPDLDAFLREGAPETVDRVWKSLRVLDEAVECGENPSNSVLWALLTGPYLLGLIEEPPAGTDVGQVLQDSFLKTTSWLRVGRREAERVKLLLLARGRLEKGIEAGRLPKSLVNRPYYEDAVTFLDLLFKTEGRDLPAWIVQRKTEDPDRPGAGKAAPAGRSGSSRRRRRRGRRSKAASGAEGEAIGPAETADAPEAAAPRPRRKRATKKASAAAGGGGEREAQASGETSGSGDAEGAPKRTGKRRSSRRRRRRRAASGGEDAPAKAAGAEPT